MVHTFIAGPHAALEGGFYEGFFIPKGTFFSRTTGKVLPLIS